MRTVQPEPAVAVGAALGEGPVWDAATGRLLLVDILPGRVLRVEPDGTVSTIVQLDEMIGAALPTADGRLLLATQTGLAVAGPDPGGEVAYLDRLLADRDDLRFNDAKCDPAGRAFAGTLSLIEAPADGALYRLDDGPTATQVVAGVGLANGLGWSPDGRWLYFADTPAGRVDRYAYDLASGELGRQEPFLTGIANPDGLCVDADGCVWLALWDGREVRRYTPAGDLDTVVPMPVPFVTSCAFGDADGQTLYITTAQGGLSDAQAAEIGHVGDVFAVRPGTSAPPATPWRPVTGD